MMAEPKPQQTIRRMPLSDLPYLRLHGDPRQLHRGLKCRRVSRRVGVECSDDVTPLGDPAMRDVTELVLCGECILANNGIGTGN